jgi:hypothetical protein
VLTHGIETSIGFVNESEAGPGQQKSRDTGLASLTTTEKARMTIQEPCNAKALSDLNHPGFGDLSNRDARVHVLYGL